MRVLMLGVGDAFTREHFGCSALIQAPGGPVLIDCPDPIHRMVHDATAGNDWRVEIADIHDVILTHIHGDHSNGLESFGFAHIGRRRRDPQRPIPRLHTNRFTAARLWEKLAPAMDGSNSPLGPRMLSDFFDVRELQPSFPAEVAGLSVRCRFTNHSVPCIGLLINQSAADAGGRGPTLGWSGDSLFEPEHLEWLNEADVIVHEAGGLPFHTGLDQLAALPEAIRMKLRLIHVPDEVARSYNGLFFLNEGDVLEI